MNSFGLSAGVIAFPGSVPQPEAIAAAGYRILTLPLRASLLPLLGGLKHLENYIRAALNSCWTASSLVLQ